MILVPKCSLYSFTLIVLNSSHYHVLNTVIMYQVSCNIIIVTMITIGRLCAVDNRSITLLAGLINLQMFGLKVRLKVEMICRDIIVPLIPVSTRRLLFRCW